MRTKPARLGPASLCTCTLGPPIPGRLPSARGPLPLPGRATQSSARGLLTSGTLTASPSALGLDVTSLEEPSQPRGQVGPTLKSGTCVLSHLFPAPSLPGQSWISAVTSQSAFPEAPPRCPGCTPLRLVGANCTPAWCRPHNRLLGNICLVLNGYSWRRTWQPTPGFLPGESHGQRSLVGYSPPGRKESETTERLLISKYTLLSLFSYSLNLIIAIFGIQ